MDGTNQSMRHSLHRKLGRAALAVVLLLATQVAFAGQLCRAVMVGNAAGGAPMLAHAAVPDGVEASACCDGAPPSGDACLTALAGAIPVATSVGARSPSDVALPLVDRSPVARIAARSAPILPLAASARTATPAYILFLRFLS
ncbi:MAG: hypothetical protein ABIR52_08930 [Casimicrobiaceae bacterium]